MQSDTVSVLRHRRVFASCDPEATRAFMAQKEFYLDVSPREVGAFDFAASALYLPHSYIGCVQYGSAASVRVPEHRKRDDYFMHLPLRGDGRRRQPGRRSRMRRAPGRDFVPARPSS